MSGIDQLASLQGSLAHTIAGCHPKLSRGQVWCVRCGSTLKVDAARCLSDGWPKCCGQTMTIDSPEERKK